MPKLIQTTGDRGLDRELDDLRREIAALKVAPAAAPAAAAPSNPTGKQIPTLLDDLDDVNAAAPASGDVLEWNGSEWVPDKVVNSLDGFTGDVKTQWSRLFMR